ncbi:MAG: asparagine--tRNA ligase, partial [Thermoplasmata archaeon]
YEMRAKEFHVVSFAEKFPIQQDLSEEFLLDVRHLWVRSQRMTSVFRVRHTVFGAVHDYFRDQGFWEVHPPMITPVGSEGGATLFNVEYFGRKAYLTQSWQLYAEALALAMEKVYYIGPSFRAEKSRTTRHLTEYWHCEMEQAWAGMDDVLKHAEGAIAHAAHAAAETNADDLRFLGRDPEMLKRVHTPFEHITYEEAFRRIKEKGMEFEWGKDLRTFEERALTEGKEQPIIVSHYPRVSQAFYKRRDPQNAEVVLGFDVIAGDDVGEIVGGSERETDLEYLKQAIVQFGEDPKNYEWYLDTRRYGNVQHAGFGMGMERLIQWICKLDHIRDAVPFPRTPARFAP